MPLILAVLTFAFFIGIGYLSNYVKKRFLLKPALEGVVPQNRSIASQEFARERRVAILPALDRGTVRVEGYAVPESLYYHQGHTWVAPQDSGTALIGIDEFASKFVGPPASVSLPPVGETFRQGEKGWSMSKEGRTLGMIFPIDGKVVAVNEQVIRDPGLIAREPYGKGWLIMVESKTLKRNLRNLLKSAVARRWMEESAAELRSLFSRRLGVVFPDGGLPEDGVADYINGEEWQEFVRRMFLLE
jgi:glycine cleavage system H lipoate-binding protein